MLRGGPAERQVVHAGTVTESRLKVKIDSENNSAFSLIGAVLYIPNQIIAKGDCTYHDVETLYDERGTGGNGNHAG